MNRASDTRAGAPHLLWLAVLIAAAVPAAAQHYHVRQYLVDDGLPSPRVHDVTQDAAGRIWFATRAGVAAYDGREWATYNLAHGLAWADQFALRWDRAGTLWSISSAAPFRIFFFRDGRWHELPAPLATEPDLRITAFALFAEGRFAIGTAADGILLRTGETWRRLGRAEGLPSDEIRQIVADDDRLLVATARGLAVVQGGAVEPLDVLPRPGADVRGLALETAGPAADPAIWVLGADWIGRLENDRFTLAAGGLALPAGGARLHAAADRRGGLYFGDEASFHHFHPEDGLTRIGRDNGLAADGVTALFVDRENILWAGSGRGVTKLISREFARYDRRQGLYDDEVTAILERRSGELVLGHRDGLTFLDGDRVRTRELFPGARRAAPRALGRASELAEDAAGRLWVAAGSSGVARVDGARIRWFGPGDGLDGLANSVRVDAAGRVWAATGEGLFLFRDGGFVRPPGAPPVNVRRVFESRDSELLLAAASGLYRFDGDAWARSACDRAAACNSVFAVHEDPDGSLWIGTAAGLHRAGANGLRHGGAAGLEIERPIFFILRDPRGRMWLGTDDGVLRWDGDELERFTVEDGLAGRETYRAAALVDSHGDLWIGTERGVTRYAEGRPGPPRGPPIVSLTELDVSGQILSLSRTQKLGHADNDLIFHFRAVSLLDEERIRTRSWLEGFETDWLPPAVSPDRQIRYTNLPPGRYVFHLQAANAEGTWSQPVSSATLTIARPFWQRAWFFLLVAGVLGAVSYSTVSFLSQRSLSRRLEAEVAERLAQLRRSEEGIRAEKERLAVTLRSIGDGVVTTDAEGVIVLFNPAAEAVTGFSSDQAVGRRLEEVLRLYRETGGEEDERKPLAPPTLERHEAYRETRPAVLETRAGELCSVELSAAPIRGADGGSSGLVIAFRDVTERRRTEAELAKAQKLEALGLLAGGIAHDFNNFLTVLLGHVTLLRRWRGTDRRQEKSLENAEIAVLRARDLTRQLLTFSRGGAPVRMAASISEVIRDSTSFVLSGSKVRSEIDLPDDLWVVEIDTGQISQVINNLLINALQAMPEGGTVRVAGRNTDRPPSPLAGGRYVVIEVADQGIGIPASHLDRIFDPYFSTKAKGRGLGLASAYSIAKRHEGHLAVESKPGRGTTFRLYLPASERPLPAIETEIELHRGSGSILVMDDDRAVREVTGSIIEQLGYRVTYASDGREAVDRYRDALAAQPFDAVIMDLTIPGGMGGQEAIVRLRSIDPEVRAIVMSGYSNNPVLANYRDYGFCGMISKPFQTRDLARTLAEILHAGS